MFRVFFRIFLKVRIFFNKLGGKITQFLTQPLASARYVLKVRQNKSRKFTRQNQLIFCEIQANIFHFRFTDRTTVTQVTSKLISNKNLDT